MGRLPPTDACEVCGDRSYGKHYGVYSCDGCACFFKRSVRRGASFTCKAGTESCAIDELRRNCCSHCRLKKCFTVGMKREFVQGERGPRVQNLAAVGSSSRSSQPSQPLPIPGFKSVIAAPMPTMRADALTMWYHASNNAFLYRPRPVKILTAEIESNRREVDARFLAEDTVRYEVAAQIFLATVQAARRHPKFSMLALAEQNRVLSKTWPAAFVLRAAVWPVNLAVFLPSNSADDVAAARNVVSTLHPDPVEFSVLETLLLCRPEIAETTNSFRLMSRATDNAVETLARHLADRNEYSTRSTKLMLILPVLTAFCPRKLAADLFAPIIGYTNLEKVIASIH